MFRPHSSAFRNSRSGRNPSGTTQTDAAKSSSSAVPKLNEGKGLGKVADSDYARRCKELMKLDRDLHNLNAGIDFDIPRIVVIGKQSAGKSSLIEAISEISVPRDGAGTCTRCPMEFFISTDAESWSCDISIRRAATLAHDRESHQIINTSQFGEMLSDKSLVEIWLRRAQAAILNPSTDASNFYNKSADQLRAMVKGEENELEFSSDVVVVELRDPSLTDLSFIDLPGIISNADLDIVHLIKTLVSENIKRDNTIVLVTMPMGDDIETAEAMLLAKQADPNGKRTIGVVTKPDDFGDGSIAAPERWKKIVLGEEHPLRHGYYIVRLPNDEERAMGTSPAEMSTIATNFFANTSPWSAFPDRTRLGTAGLVADVSKLLVEMIEKNLPKLRQSVDAALANTMAQIASLPIPFTSDYSANVFLLVNEFAESIRKAVMAEAFRGLVHTNQGHYTKFAEDIRLTRPDFRAVVRHREWPDAGLVAIDEIREGDVHGEVPRPQAFGQWGASIPPPESVASLNSPSTQNAELPGSPIPQILEPYVEALDLSQVRRVINDSRGWELPDHVPFEASRELLLRHTRKWKEPSHRCFAAVFASSSHFIEGLAEDQLRSFGRLKTFIMEIARKEMEKLRTDVLASVDKLLELEQIPLYTQNLHYYNETKAKWRRKYTNVYNDSLPSRQAGGKEYEKELEVMASVRAYFQVAYKRIIDYLPLTIEHQLLQEFSRRLKTLLLKGLLADSSDKRMEELLSEDPDVAARRAYLEDRATQLREIQRKLNEICK